MSWAHEKPTIFSDEDELQLKLEFARLCAEDPANIAMHGYTLFPGETNYGRAMAAQKWIDDPLVQREISRLRAENVEELLDEKAQFAKRMMDKGNACNDPKTALGYYELFAKVMDYLPKQGGNNVQLNLTQNVIEVPTRARDDELPFLEGEWAEQQRKLVADARSARPN